jgi:exopolyphosphatase/guanosine-5'-triphosphate,3'-diphosphate pyrophosphatase
MPGCAIFVAIQRICPAPQVVVADRGLREGMLLRMMRAERSRPRGRRFDTGAPCRAAPPAMLPGAGVALDAALAGSKLQA